MPGGRPSALTSELQAEVVKLATAGVPKNVIADALSIDRSTLNYWLHIGASDYQHKPGTKKPPDDLTPYQEFSDAFKRARAQAIITCEATWMKAIHTGDAAQAAHWLKVHEPSLYRDEASVHHTFGDRQAAMDTWKQQILDMDKKPPADADAE